jgi:DNA-binding SARP family transcriptional activator
MDTYINRGSHTIFMPKEEPKTKKWIFEMSEKLDEDFRKAIAKEKGLHRGVIKEALSEAIKEWIENHGD